MSLCRVTTVFSRRLPALATAESRAMFGSDSKDKGGAGAIRDAGGSFAKREAAQEDQYFRKLQQEQLKNLKSHVDDEIKHHQEEIERHQESIKRLKEKAKDLNK